MGLSADFKRQRLAMFQSKIDRAARGEYVNARELANARTILRREGQDMDSNKSLRDYHSAK